MIEYAVIALAIFLGFSVKGVVGFAEAMIAMPILIIVLSFPQAIVLLSLAGITFALIELPQIYKQINTKIFFFMAPGLAIGLGLSLFILKIASESTLRWLLAIILVIGVSLNIFKKKMKLPRSASTAAGLLGGVLSGSVGIGGPIFVTYIETQKITAQTARATLIAVIAVSDMIKVPALLISNLIAPADLLLALAALPVVGLAVLIGNMIANHIPERIHHALIITVLTISTIMMLGA